MQYRTVTECIGEWLGTVDWDHEQAAKLEGERAAMLREAAASPEDFEATSDTGWPKVGWGRIVRVGMYDGWPYWQPTPSVQIEKWDGLNTMSFNAICGIRRAKAHNTIAREED